MNKHPTWKAKVKPDDGKLKATVVGHVNHERVVLIGRAITIESAIGAALHVRARFGSNQDELATLRTLMRGEEIEFDLVDREIRVAA